MSPIFTQGTSPSLLVSTLLPLTVLICHVAIQKTAGKKGTARKEVFALSRDQVRTAADTGAGFCVYTELVLYNYLLGSSLPLFLHWPPVPRDRVQKVQSQCAVWDVDVYHYQQLNHPAETHASNPTFYLSSLQP